MRYIGSSTGSNIIDTTAIVVVKSPSEFKVDQHVETPSEENVFKRRKNKSEARGKVQLVDLTNQIEEN